LDRPFKRGALTSLTFFVFPVPRPSAALDPRPPVPFPLPPAPTGFTSLIVARFPALFAEFRWKRFTLLWRGSRNGFGANAFHGCYRPDLV
jgi:hypothetical protein